MKATFIFCDQISTTSTFMAPVGLEATATVAEVVGRDVKLCGGERLCCLHLLHSSSVTATRTGNQSTAALSVHAIGPEPATMNVLSAALNVACLFDNKFRNVWISLLVFTFVCSGALREQQQISAFQI